MLERVYQQVLKQAKREMGTGCDRDVWQWDTGVMFYGLVKAYEKSGDEEIYAFIKEWVDFHMGRKDFGFSINTTAPLLSVMKLLEREPENKAYYDVCKRFADWCLAEEPRADLGTFEHSCTVNKYPNQIWADTLFMGCLFLIKWGLYTGEQVYIREAIRQFELHYHFLKDANGLIYHGYDCNERAHKGIAWGRGNSWLAMAAIEVLNLLDKNTEGYDKILAIYHEHIGAALRFQAENGWWHTVIDREDTYLEMSATAAFGYSILRAVHTGFLDGTYLENAQKALNALKADVDADGCVLHGSIGTCVMEDYHAYNDVPFGYSCFMQGIAMMLLSEE